MHILRWPNFLNLNQNKIQCQQKALSELLATLFKTTAESETNLVIHMQGKTNPNWWSYI